MNENELNELSAINSYESEMDEGEAEYWEGQQKLADSYAINEYGIETAADPFQTADEY
jgi:hypothetical protein